MLETELLRKIVQEGVIYLYKEGKETEELMETCELRKFLSKMNIRCATIFGEFSKGTKNIFSFEGEQVYVDLIKCIENTPYGLEDNSGCFSPITEKSVDIPSTSVPGSVGIIVYSEIGADSGFPEGAHVWNDKEYGVGKIGKYILATILSNRYEHIILANEEVNFDMSRREIDNLTSFASENPNKVGCQKGFDFINGFFDRKKQLSGKKCEYTSSNLSIYPSNIFVDFMKWYLIISNGIKGVEDLLFCTWCKINNIEIQTVENSGTIFKKFIPMTGPEDRSAAQIEEIYKNTWCSLQSISEASDPDWNRFEEGRCVYIITLNNPRMRRIREITEKSQYCVYDTNIIWSSESNIREYVEDYIKKSDIWCPKTETQVKDNEIVKMCEINGDSIKIGNPYSGVKYNVSIEMGISIDDVTSKDISFNYIPDSKTSSNVKEIFKSTASPLIIIFGRQKFDFYYDFIGTESYSLLFMKECSEITDWYLTLLEHNLQYLRSKIEESKATKVITLGIKEGGFSSILYAKLLNADKAISISPIFPSRESVNKSRRKYINLNKVMGSCKEIITDCKKITGKNVKYYDNGLDPILLSTIS